MKTRLGTLLTCVLAFFLLMAVPALADDLPTSGTCGENLTWTLDSDGVLTISGTGDMDSQAWWQGGRTSITSVHIENGVTSIGERAFFECGRLRSVTIPDSVTSIGEFAFYACDELTSVTIPNSVTSIGACAFRRCDGLTSVTIPASVTSISAGMFMECWELVSVTIPVSVTSIGEMAFLGCGLTDVYYTGTEEQWNAITIDSDPSSDHANAIKSATIHYNAFTGTCGENLTWTIDSEFVVTISGTGDLTDTDDLRAFDNIITSVHIEEGVTSIGEYAFSRCTGLTSVTIPDSVTSIGEYAFSRCTGLTSVTIPDSVTSIGEYAFSGCSSLTSIIVAEGNPAYISYDGVLFDKEKKTQILFPAGKTGAYVIPDNVTRIGNYMFSQCTGLTSITIPDSVTSIGYSAFSGCTGLTSVNISDNTNIDMGAFSGCTGLTSVSFGSGISIGYSAFSGCTGLTSVTISDNTNIDMRAFSGCTGLTSVSFGSGISIGLEAFSGCTGLTSVSFGSGISIGREAFSGCTGLTSVNIPDNTGIGGEAFFGCTGLTSVTIPVTGFGTYAFANCTNLTDVYYGGSAEQWREMIQTYRYYKEMYPGIQATGSVPINDEPILNATIHYAYALVSVSKSETGTELNVTLDNSRAAVVAAAFFDGDRFLTVVTAEAAADCGSVSVPLPAGLPETFTARVMLLDQDLRPLCARVDYQ